MSKPTPEIDAFVSTLKAWLDYSKRRMRPESPTALDLAKAITPILWELIDSLSDADLDQLKAYCDSDPKLFPEEHYYELHPMALLNIALLSDLESAWDLGAQAAMIHRRDDCWKVKIRGACGFVGAGTSEPNEGPCNAAYDALDQIEEHHEHEHEPRYDA